mmetsp:Transcript_48198/g.151372  ORF Transcript_48198/g.151372 Transcript_48198/m.151372 type:complete len:273 (+) Transcript_48198:414-1232(+)
MLVGQGSATARGTGLEVGGTSARPLLALLALLLPEALGLVRGLPASGRRGPRRRGEALVRPRLPLLRLDVRRRRLPGIRLARGGEPPPRRLAGPGQTHPDLALSEPQEAARRGGHHTARAPGAREAHARHRRGEVDLEHRTEAPEGLPEQPLGLVGPSAVFGVPGHRAWQVSDLHHAVGHVAASRVRCPGATWKHVCRCTDQLGDAAPHGAAELGAHAHGQLELCLLKGGEREGRPQHTQTHSPARKRCYRRRGRVERVCSGTWNSAPGCWA